MQLSQAQIISILLFAIGLVFIVLMIVKKEKLYEWAKPEIKPINIKKDK
jgi:prolipoprotein diacylglyceryltransferase